MNKFLVIRDSTNNGTPANLGASPTKAVTVFKNTNGTDQSGNLTITVIDSAHGLIGLNYDPAVNGDAAGYITVAPGGAGASPVSLTAGDGTPAVSFDFDEVQVPRGYVGV